MIYQYLPLSYSQYKHSPYSQCFGIAYRYAVLPGLLALVLNQHGGLQGFARVVSILVDHHISELLSRVDCIDIHHDNMAVFLRLVWDYVHCSRGVDLGPKVQEVCLAFFCFQAKLLA